MMPWELPYQPFERSIAGLRGTVILRRNEDHAERCKTAIRRRSHPAWSQLNCGYQVAA
jgi:hypothetical protein